MNPVILPHHIRTTLALWSKIRKLDTFDDLDGLVQAELAFQERSE